MHIFQSFPSVRPSHIPDCVKRRERGPGLLAAAGNDDDDGRLTTRLALINYCITAHGQAVSHGPQNLHDHRTFWLDIGGVQRRRCPSGFGQGDVGTGHLGVLSSCCLQPPAFQLPHAGRCCWLPFGSSIPCALHTLPCGGYTTPLL